MKTRYICTVRSYKDVPMLMDFLRSKRGRMPLGSYFKTESSQYFWEFYLATADHEPVTQAEFRWLVQSVNDFLSGVRSERRVQVGMLAS